MEREADSNKLNMPTKLFCLLMVLGLLMQSGCSSQRELPAVIVGSSMAPTFLGEHWKIHCEDCQFPIRFELPPSPRDSDLIVCPNCSYLQSFSKRTPRQPAQNVSVQPTNSLHRWDLIAFRIPGGKHMGIKRIVGLPGETIEFCNGKIFVEGQLQKKTWLQQRQMRILVHDSNFVPLSLTRQRWEPLNPQDSTAWELTSVQWTFRRPTETLLTTDPKPVHTEPDWHWLNYRHWRGCRHTGPRDLEFPIEDLDSFNQGLSRNLNPTAELMLEVDGRFDSDSMLGFRFFRGSHELSVELDFADRSASIRQTTLACPTISSEDELNPPATTVNLGESIQWNLDAASIQKIEVSTFDDQLILAFNGDAVARAGIPPVSARIEANSLLQIGAANGQLELRRIRIYRDIYYLPADRNKRENLRLTADREHFLLIGDNVPMSTDSRHWRNGGIDKKFILGKLVELKFRTEDDEGT
jgi:signal peptidase I